MCELNDIDWSASQASAPTSPLLFRNETLEVGTKLGMFDVLDKGAKAVPRRVRAGPIRRNVTIICICRSCLSGPPIRSPCTDPAPYHEPLSAYVFSSRY